ncbi:tyrosine-type recombinase/integrase [Salinibacter grassmerensis]|uniref:tyrosine-type recombinase/integrase n=1 Tax=Salinibacter grassmerensis TaxID=3040353 RepID=UPI0021E857CA|nr:site-specific integrase [Salinibacter grassmerensis]
MSSIYTKRGVYYYQAYVTKEDEKERVGFSLKTKEETEAKKKQRKWDDYYRKLERGEDLADTTFEEAKEDYLELRRMKERAGELSDYTINSDRLALKMFGRWIEEESGIDPYILTAEPNEDHIRDFKYWRLQSVSSTTVETNLRHLSSFFSWLHDQQVIDSRPFSRIHIPQPESDVEVPSQKEFDEIKKEIKHRVYNEDDRLWKALWIQANAGLRIGEVIRLTWHKTFTDRGKYAYLNQSNRTATIQFKRKNRVIPLKHIWDEIQLIDNDGTTPYVFESPQRETHVDRSNWSRRTGHFLTEIGYEEMTNHSLRHMFITELVKKDYSYEKIARMVGQSSRRIVSMYAHLDAGDLEDMMDSL